MKKNDLALLVLIVSLTLVISFLLVKALFGEPQQAGTQVEKVEPIASEITQPSSQIFNRGSINPTVVIQIGDPGQQKPFGQ